LANKSKQGPSNDNESGTSTQASAAGETNTTLAEASGESDNTNGDSNGTKRQLDSPLNGQNSPKRAKPQGDSPAPVVEPKALSDTNSTILQPEANESTAVEQMDVEESKPTPPTNGDTPAEPSTSEEKAKPLPPPSSTAEQQTDAMEVEETKSHSSDDDGANVIDNNTNYDDTNIDYRDLIDPALADVMRLEDMVIPKVDPLESLTFRDLAQLEAALQIGDHYNYGEDDGWKGDWAGNLDLFRKEVVVNKNYLNTQPSGKPIRIDYCDWVASNARDHNDLRGLELLFRYVYHMKGTPAMAKKILAYALQRPAKSSEERLDFIIKAANRMNYDPIVLQQDGWTIKKADSPEGPLGGAIYIGKRVMWQKHEAVVVGYIPDETYGGLWKGVFLEDLDTFDMEPGELQRGLKKWENKQRQKTTRSNAATGSTRFAATAKFVVPGIENGIILAKPTNRAAKGLLWPARVRNVVEGKLTAEGKVRRNSSKNQIHVIFLAPFWNAQEVSPSKMADATDPYSLGPLFEYDTVEVSEYNIQEYALDSISIEKLEASFKFHNLPKAVFPRYLDSHRLAVSLKTYAEKHMPKNRDSEDQLLASASLTESHILSVKAPIFPNVVLNLPFDYILSKLAHPLELASASLDNTEEETQEPVIDIDGIVHSLSPPDCFGQKSQTPRTSSCLSPEVLPASPDPHFTPAKSAKRALQLPDENHGGEDADTIWSINKFASDFLMSLFQTEDSSNEYFMDGVAQLGKMMTALVLKLRQTCSAYGDYEMNKKVIELKKILCQCLLMKGHGEDCLEYSTIPPGMSKATIISEWRKACERIYKRAVSKLSFDGVGNGMTSVITDSRCNGHITQMGSFERPVRLPAAIKGAKRAGAGKSRHVTLLTEVEDNYYSMAENVVIPKAHKKTYIKRLKTKIQSIPPDQKGVPLTDDSEGEGGDDTMGSRGSYAAAVVGIGASLKAVDMVVTGKCVNVFCAIRPPGHHAGLELRPMKAVSNGFCLFNAAACAAIYATTPVSQGGLGLRRVCVIDFDVHHGNGTQDILCSTYDPRYLYVSIHAGGAHINGFEDEDSEDESFRLRLGGKKTEGIFPGRCGDTSPHKGVLNIPLGQKVTASAMGTALVSQVTPRVEEFSPDLIILSAGFDAHENDPLGMGGLTAADFGSVTEVACQMAHKACSGRILSVLEGGYGVPCCRPRNDLFLPNGVSEERLLDLGEDLPATMGDEVHYTLRQKLDQCHQEGFLDCVQAHVQGLVKCNARK
jgi:acetoin utilization deacetylase AcuC-like enzyme